MRVLIVDDQAMIRAGIRGLLTDAGIDVAGEASNGREAIDLARSVRPDVVLLDLRMPILGGVRTVELLRADADLVTIRVLVLTTFDGDAEVLDALRAGADGFLGKAADPEELVQALNVVSQGGVSLSTRAMDSVLGHLRGSHPATPDPKLAQLSQSLTARERDVVIAAAEGLDNQQIAAVKHLSPHTVKTHLNRAMTKVNARERGQLVAFAYRAGLIRP